MGSARQRKGSSPRPSPLLSTETQRLCTSTPQLLPTVGPPRASLHPSHGLTQATPTLPDCNLSADLLERQRQKAHVEAEGERDEDSLPGAD